MEETPITYTRGSLEGPWMERWTLWIALAPRVLCKDFCSTVPQIHVPDVNGWPRASGILQPLSVHCYTSCYKHACFTQSKGSSSKGTFVCLTGRWNKQKLGRSEVHHPYADVQCGDIGSPCPTVIPDAEHGWQGEFSTPRKVHRELGRQPYISLTNEGEWDPGIDGAKLLHQVIVYKIIYPIYFHNDLI